MSKLKFKILAIEITKKCNLKCKHCLKGDAQDVNISDFIIEKLFSMIESIDYLCITGGEPTLNIYSLKKIYQEILKNNVSIGSWSIPTNGVYSNTDFVEVCNKLTELSQDPKSCLLRISLDKYHFPDDVPEYTYYTSPRYLSYKIKKYGNYNFNIKPNYTNNWGYIKTGRAKELLEPNSLATEKETPFKVNRINKNKINVLYVSARGDLFVDNNLTFEDEDANKYSYGNVINLSANELIDTIHFWNEKYKDNPSSLDVDSILHEILKG